MKLRSSLGALASLSALSLVSLSPSAANASPGLEAHDGSLGRRFVGTPPLAARAYLRAFESELGLGDVELEQGIVLPAAGGTTVRFAQRYRGLPVFGAAVAVRVGPDGAVSRAALRVARGVGLPTTPTLTETDARVLVASLVGGHPSDIVRIALGVLPDDEAPARLVWQADVPQRGGQRIMVDALSGEPISRVSLVTNVTGEVFRISARATPNPTNELLLDLSAEMPQRLDGFAGRLSIYEYVSGNPNQEAVKVQQTISADSTGNFTFPPPADWTDPHDSFAAVNAYYHLHRIRSFFTDTLKVDMTPASWSLGAVVNVKLGADPMDNAAFISLPLGAPANKENTIVIGQGTTIDFAYDSGVFLHEFTHYVAHNAIDYSQGQFGADSYGLNTFAGSIDEGTADYFACTVNDDSVLGKTALGAYSRDLSENVKVCPDDLVGEVHEDGRLIGGVAWAIRTLVGKHLADEIVWSALTTLTKSASLGDFATGVTKSADELVAKGALTVKQRDAIAALLQERGLDDCGRVLSLDKGPRQSALLGLRDLSQLLGGTCSSLAKEGVALPSLFHFSKTPGAGASAITISVAMQTSHAGTLDYDIFVRAKSHVSFSTALGSGLPKAIKYDYKLTGNTAPTATLTIDAASTPSLDPAAVYDIVVVSRNCPTTLLEVSAVDGEAPVASGGAGGASGGGTHGGAPAVGGHRSTGSARGGAGGASAALSAAPDASANEGGSCAVRANMPRSSSGGATALLAVLGLVAGRRTRRSDDA